MATGPCRNNEGVCLLGTCCVPVGKIKMHVFRQVFIADLISSRRADRGGAVCLFLFCFLTLQRAPPSVLGRMWGRQQRARGQPALINNHLLCASAVTICRGFLLLPESMTLCCAGAAAGALPPCWCLPDLPPSSYLNRIWAKKKLFSPGSG